VNKPHRKKPVVHPLVQYLEAKRLSQQEFGDSVGVSQGLVWQWLNWRTGITPAKAREIEKVHGIPRLRLLYPEERAA
jgi:transcriptional regulator with XRE-family HTH domain